MRFLICPNAFKGSLTASQAAQAISEGIRRATEERGVPIPAQRRSLPLADGGDGTLETLVEASRGTLHTVTVRGPLGMPVQARWGRMGGERSDTAILEMAEASGLRLLRHEARDATRATTYGTGELIRAALEAGCRSLLIGIGGSATNDGGAGMAQALGARLLDAQGRELPPGGAALQQLGRIVWQPERVLPPGTRFLVACDVDNPLCGPQGASAIYGPQKGATPEQVVALDRALAHYAAIVKRDLGKEVAEIPGAGAAGGLGAGLLAFCSAEVRSGIETVMEATGFEEALRNCDLVLTGEGRLDGQTGRGKVIAGVARRAQAQGIPVIALVGGIADGAEQKLRAVGLTAVFSILEAPSSVEEAMRDGYRLLGEAAERVTRLALIGRDVLP